MRWIVVALVLVGCGVDQHEPCAPVLAIEVYQPRLVLDVGGAEACVEVAAKGICLPAAVHLAVRVADGPVDGEPSARALQASDCSRGSCWGGACVTPGAAGSWLLEVSAPGALLPSLLRVEVQ